MNAAAVPFLDLSRQDRELADELGLAFSRFLQGGIFILGPEVSSLEKEFASSCGARAGVGVASGTDALLLALKAAGARPGDGVITPALSAPPTAVAVSLSGAEPVFVDIDADTRCMDPEALRRGITPRSRFVLVVHLYGRMADMTSLARAAAENDLVLIEDCAQAHGAAMAGRAAGTWGKAGCFSFYPTKNLGAYGDAGMIVTADEEYASRLRGLRDYGRVDRDHLGEIGQSSRLDELQAALLRVKLPRLDAWNRRRRELASNYLDGLAGLPLRLPQWDRKEDHCFHLFVVECERRDSLRSYLEGRGIQTAVHYPLPLHLQRPYLRSGFDTGSFPVAERLAQQAISLPLYPHLTDAEQEMVIGAVRDYFRRSRSGR
ncbi:MAG: DegT/DnrJ/EryC1/StrS family aminotransferase [Actinomycetota bacterium]